MPKQFSTNRSAVEAAVVRIMTDVLATDGLTAGDSFYDHGGNSLQAIRICARIRGELGIQISPEVIFELDTVEGLCKAVSALRQGPPGTADGPATGEDPESSAPSPSGTELRRSTCGSSTRP